MIESTQESTTASETVPPPSLQDRIQTLTDVHNRLQALRHVPSLLLKPPSISTLAEFPPSFDTAVDREFAATFNSTPAHDFRALNDFLGMLRSVKVQEALRAARASEAADQTELGLSFRRENRKRKRPQSPVGSPQPYIPSPPRTSSLFPPPEDDPPPVRAESLVEFVRDFNRGTLPELKMTTATEADAPPLPKCKLTIWSRTKMLRDELKGAISADKSRTSASAGKLTSPVVLRFVITDVLTAYISLVITNLEDQLVVESVTAFGPRERKLPHEQSDYQAFQILTQYIAKMISSHPRVPLQILISVLVSYRGLFVDRCTSCQRVLSTEGHIPPVGRMWFPKETQTSNTTIGKLVVNVDSPGPPATHPTPARDDAPDHATGHWEARHATCLYS